MAYLVINGVDCSNVASYEVTLADLDSNLSTRNESGYLYRDRLRANVPTIKVEFGYLTFSEGSTILQAVTAAYFTVSYLSPLTGDIESGTFYASDRSASLLGTTTDLQYWSSISFDLVSY